MVSKDHDLSQRRQWALLQLSRATLYYRPVGESAENLRYMEIIDKQFLETPWYGSRQMARHMRRQGHKCGRHHAGRAPSAPLAPANAPDATCAYLSGAQHQQEAPGAQDLSLPSERAGDHPTQPGLVCRYHLYPDGARVPLAIVLGPMAD
jgi:putative transposase